MRKERIKHIRNNIDKEWSNHYFKFIEENQDKKLYWYSISANPNITMEIIRDNPDKPWNWRGISRNPNLNWDFIINNPDKPWDWCFISYNPNITMDMILDNPDKPWDWYSISYNPNITMDMIQDNPDKPWNWYNISNTNFKKEKELFINRKYREHMASYKIQQWCLSIIISPHYKIGRTLINKKYKELFDS